MISRHLARSPFLRNLGWWIIAIGGGSYLPAGILLIALAWQPTPGPYLVGERYPFGSDMSAWQVSAGFGFAAFGLLFVALVVAARKDADRVLLGLAFVSYLLMWLPHAWLGAAFIIDDPSLRGLGEWRDVVPLIVLWVVLMVAGFVLAWTEVDLRRRQGPAFGQAKRAKGADSSSPR